MSTRGENRPLYSPLVLTFDETKPRHLSFFSEQSRLRWSVYMLPLSMAASYIGNDNVGVYAYPIGANIRIWYNMGPKAGAIADLKVRQAIDKALNFDAIAAVGTAGFAKEVRSYFPDNSIYYHEIFSDEERAVDIEGAKALLNR